MGKTSLATNMAFHASRLWAKDKADGREPKRGAPVLLFSLEMAASQLSARILSEQTEIEMRKIRTGRFPTRNGTVSSRPRRCSATCRSYIDDTGGISIAQIAARARRLKREKHIGLIVIDYLQLVEPSRRARTGCRKSRKSRRASKRWPRNCRVPVMALSQLSRGVDNRDDKRPLALGFARIRLHRTGRRRGDVRLSRGILSAIPRARSRHLGI
jgi:replicative DNA helicase